MSVMPNAIRADRASLTSDDRATYTVTHKHVPIDTRQDPVNETPRFTSPTAQPYLRFSAGRVSQISSQQTLWPLRADPPLCVNADTVNADTVNADTVNAIYSTTILGR